MVVTYTTALAALKDAAGDVRASRLPAESQVRVSLEEAVGRIAACDCTSTVATPEFDTSAMDGYAVRSEATRRASPQHPVVLEVQGTIAAGDDPFFAAWAPILHAGIEPCAEIMTGGRFPHSGAGADLDACVRLEDVVVKTSMTGTANGPSARSTRTLITLTKPVPRHANRRFAGTDIQKGQVVLRAGQVINSASLIPLASVGIKSVLVAKKQRVAVWSTGKELLSGSSRVPDVNGIFLAAAAREFGADVSFLGVLDDEPASITRAVADALVSEQPPNILVTSGGVSAGKFDFVRRAMERMGATIVFHGIAIRPGHPVLFALLPSNRGKVAFFGLPGNPGAASACFRFVVVPYLRQIASRGSEAPVPAKLLNPEADITGKCDRPATGIGLEPLASTPNRDHFRPGLLLKGRARPTPSRRLGEIKVPLNCGRFCCQIAGFTIGKIENTGKGAP
ncbi:unnamed protein product [Parascedosporium putredinis]|uniref:molybdopterin adenylyltransferase n=1 Tax=Parascedosporium putredinis TaxID=1442378 RepID=A0A9P1M6N1_9PEZI|nr:unnamed protein product [Parascedosporium putredinis]CAI7987522.1 unnamed protein product [Parascedosporium putredinis]